MSYIFTYEIEICSNREYRIFLRKSSTFCWLLRLFLYLYTFCDGNYFLRDRNSCVTKWNTLLIKIRWEIKIGLAFVFKYSLGYTTIHGRSATIVMMKSPNLKRTCNIAISVPAACCMNTRISFFSTKVLNFKSHFSKNGKIVRSCNNECVYVRPLDLKNKKKCWLLAFVSQLVRHA